MLTIAVNLDFHDCQGLLVEPVRPKRVFVQGRQSKRPLLSSQDMNERGTRRSRILI